MVSERGRYVIGVETASHQAASHQAGLSTAPGPHWTSDQPHSRSLLCQRGVAVNRVVDALTGDDITQTGVNVVGKIRP